MVGRSSLCARVSCPLPGGIAHDTCTPSSRHAAALLGVGDLPKRPGGHHSAPEPPLQSAGIDLLSVTVSTRRPR
jgi:hypothetical protein